MPRLQTTVGQLLVNDALPEDMRDYSRTLDKKALTALLSEVATKHPDRYREISHALSNVGRRVAYATGGFSFGLKHLRPSPVAMKARQQLRAELSALSEQDLSDEQMEKKILLAVGRASEGLPKKVYEEALASGNPLAKQVLSGSRGNPMNLSSLISQDFLYTDHRGKVMPLPVLRSYSEGLTPAEYWAGMYGARKGTMDTKFATQDAGFLSKQLNQISHRAVVVDVDGDGEPDTLRGYPVDTTDPDNEGSLLAHPAGGYARNTVLTPKVLSDLRQRKVPRILVRSPMVGGTPDGGVYARDVGMREFGRLPTAGENVGLTAAQALSEPLSQAQLSSKHSGGVAGATAGGVGGFQLINQLIQTPKTFKGGAAHSTQDGTVEHVTEAPAGGKYVQINGNQHYVGSGFELRVKPGDKVEAGDVISEGVPDPSLIVQHKGVGEGRRYFVNAFRQAFRDAGIKGHRRNIELLAKGLINHVRLTDEIGDYAPDDIVPYSALEHTYQPREGHRLLAPSAATNQYLEKPYLHYSIGTKIRPSMLKDFQEFGINEVVTHPEPPPFEPEMVRGMANMQHDPDWITRMLGSGQKSSLLDSVHRGGYSDEAGTSFVPSLAKTVNFGTIGKVQTPKPNADDDQMRASKTFKVGEDQLTKQARELMAKIKQADKPEDRHRDKRTTENRETRLGRPFMSDLTVRSIYDEAYNQAQPDAHKYKPVLPTAWSDLPSDQQQKYQGAIRHALQELRKYEEGLDRSPDYGGTGTFSSNVVLPAGINAADPFAWALGYEPHQFRLDQLGNYQDEYMVPAGTPEERPNFQLPAYGEEITDISGSPLNPWAWNPQRYIQRYNQAVNDRGPLAGETLIRAVEAMRQAYPEAVQAAEQELFSPADAWAKMPTEERMSLLQQHYGQLEPGMETSVPLEELAQSPAIPEHIQATQPKYYPDFKPTQPLVRPKDYGGMIPYTAPNGTRMVGTQEAVDANRIDQIEAKPQWNDGGYTPGYGLLPLAQMADQVTPGATQQMAQMIGPASLPLLTDVNAAGQLMRGPQQTQPQPQQQPRQPAPPPAAPAPSPPPAVPQQPTTPAAPKAPAPRPNQPQQPAPPRQPKGMTPPKSNLPKPASPVPGG